MKRLLIAILMAYLSIASAVVMKQQPCSTEIMSINQTLIQTFASSNPQDSIDEINKTQILLKYMRDFYKAFDKVLKESAEQQQINKTFYQGYLQFAKLHTQRFSMSKEDFEKSVQPSLQATIASNQELLKQLTKLDQDTFVAAQMSTAYLCPPNGALTPEAESFLQSIIDQLSAPKTIQAVPLSTTSQTSPMTKQDTRAQEEKVAQEKEEYLKKSTLTHTTHSKPKED